MLAIHLGDTPNELSDANFTAIAEKTEGYDRIYKSSMKGMILDDFYRLFSQLLRLRYLCARTGRIDGATSQVSTSAVFYSGKNDVCW